MDFNEYFLRWSMELDASSRVTSGELIDGSRAARHVAEAGQMSLAECAGLTQAAKNVVLLGEARQLEQPVKGSHPDGAAVSALEHLLGGQKTISPDKGLFLEKTWRLHPDLCDFTSEVFYKGRLVREWPSRRRTGPSVWGRRPAPSGRGDGSVGSERFDTRSRGIPRHLRMTPSIRRADELDLVFGENDSKIITDAEAAGINAYIEAAGRILKAIHSD